ncbi:MAG: hypothetical protein EBR34_16330, partial [Sphingomonadaceae bacterium]|nr:hypothetical protein [Sphingomonadaceae bacterium]
TESAYIRISRPLDIVGEATHLFQLSERNTLLTDNIFKLIQNNFDLGLARVLRKIISLFQTVTNIINHA